jgi:hypothetical protein
MSGLAFANPALVWGALAIGIPIAIHLLSRRRSRRLAFAAVDFILRSRKQKVRHIQLRQLLLLLMRALVVVCIALAIARPLLRPKEATAIAPAAHTAVALILDGSLSMRYRLSGQTLFRHAQDEAEHLLDGLPAESSATLVICDGHTPEAAAPSFDRAALRHRIEDARPTYRPADVSACMAAGAQALGQSPLEGKKIVVLSDLTVPSLRLDAPPPKVSTPKGDMLPEIVFIDAARGSALPNLGIIDVSVAPSAAIGARGFEVAATVRNSGDKPAENVALALKIGGQIVSRGFTDVPAHGTARKVLAHRFEPGTQLGQVTLEPDALIEDDSRAFVLRVPRDVRALVVDGSPSAIRYRDEAFFVEAALGPGQTAGRINAVFLDADAAQSRSLSDFDVVLLLNLPTPKASFMGALRSFVDGGGGLFVSLGDQVNPEEYNAAFGDLLPRPMHLVRTAAEPDQSDTSPPARFGRIDFQHPAFSIFEGGSEGFDSARTYRYVQLQPETGKDERVIATYDDGSPAIIEARHGRGRVVLYTSTVDRDWSDWPIRTSFLPAIQQITEYLAGGLDEKPPQPTRIGSVRPVVLPAGAKLDAVRGPDDKTVRVTEEGVPVEQPGLYQVSVRDGAGSRDLPELSFAAVLDPNESDTSRYSEQELSSHFGGESHATVAGGADMVLPHAGTPLWTYLLVAAMLALFGEGLLVRRA